MSTSLNEKHTLVVKAIVSLLEKHKAMEDFEVRTEVIGQRPYLHWRWTSEGRRGRLYPKGGTLRCGDYLYAAKVVMAEPDSISRLARVIQYCAYPSGTHPCVKCLEVK